MLTPLRAVHFANHTWSYRLPLKSQSVTTAKTLTNISSFKELYSVPDGPPANIPLSKLQCAWFCPGIQYSVPPWAAGLGNASPAYLTTQQLGTWAKTARVLFQNHILHMQHVDLIQTCIWFVQFDTLEYLYIINISSSSIIKLKW